MARVMAVAMTAMSAPAASARSKGTPLPAKPAAKGIPPRDEILITRLNSGFILVIVVSIFEAIKTAYKSCYEPKHLLSQAITMSHTLDVSYRMINTVDASTITAPTSDIGLSCSFNTVVAMITPNTGTR